MRNYLNFKIVHMLNDKLALKKKYQKIKLLMN